MIPNIYLMTCDESVWITYYTTKLINKYLSGANIYLLGYSIPNIEYDDNVTFISLKPKRIKSEWFNDIANYFKSIEDNIIIFSVDDIPIIHYVNKDFLNFSINYILNNKVALIYGNYKQTNDNKFVSKTKHYCISESPTHSSLWGFNIWKKDCLIKILTYDYSKLNERRYSFASNNITANFELYGKNILKNTKKFSNYKFIHIKKKEDNLIKQTIFFQHIWGFLSPLRYGKNTLLIGLKKEDLKIFYDKKPLYPITYSILIDRPLRFSYEEILQNNTFFNDVIQFHLKQDNKLYKFGITKKRTISAINKHYNNLHN